MIKQFGIALLSILAFSQCRKDNDSSNIPYISVNVNIDVDNPAYRDIKSPGNYVYINGGSEGIILYRLNQEEFRAYDRHSPIEPQDNCICDVTEDQLFIEDPCSGASWLITDGTPQNNAAKFFLREYQTSFNGRTVRVFN